MQFSLNFEWSPTDITKWTDKLNFPTTKCFKMNENYKNVIFSLSDDNITEATTMHEILKNDIKEKIIYEQKLIN